MAVATRLVRALPYIESIHSLAECSVRPRGYSTPCISMCVLFVSVYARVNICLHVRFELIHAWFMQVYSCRRHFAHVVQITYPVTVTETVYDNKGICNEVCANKIMACVPVRAYSWASEGNL